MNLSSQEQIYNNIHKGLWAIFCIGAAMQFESLNKYSQDNLDDSNAKLYKAKENELQNVLGSSSPLKNIESITTDEIRLIPEPLSILVFFTLQEVIKNNHEMILAEEDGYLWARHENGCFLRIDTGLNDWLIERINKGVSIKCKVSMQKDVILIIKDYDFESLITYIRTTNCL